MVQGARYVVREFQTHRTALPSLDSKTKNGIFTTYPAKANSMLDVTTNEKKTKVFRILEFLSSSAIKGVSWLRTSNAVNLRCIMK